MNHIQRHSEAASSTPKLMCVWIFANPHRSITQLHRHSNLLITIHLCDSTRCPTNSVKEKCRITQLQVILMSRPFAEVWKKSSPVTVKREESSYDVQEPTMNRKLQEHQRQEVKLSNLKTPTVRLCLLSGTLHSVMEQ